MNGAGVSIHAGALLVRETGLLIRGPAGSGKSTLAGALVIQAGLAGWFARLVADDRVLIDARGGRLLARPHPRIAGLAERRGTGLVALPYEPACVLHLVVDLVEGEDLVRMPDPKAGIATIRTTGLPRLALAARAPVGDHVYRVLDHLNRFRVCS